MKLDKKYPLTIAIPTHEMKDGEYFLRRCLDSLWNQTFQDFDIVVTDNSDNTDIQRVCDFYKTGIRYYKNPNKGMAQNTNEAIRQSTGDLIKILYMDDYMYDDFSVETIMDNFKGRWMVSGCAHSINGDDTFNPHFPTYSEEIKTGNNTIGSPSVLTIRNDDALFFDEEMTWLLDCDYYYRMNEKYGLPTILNQTNVIIGLHEGQATHTMGEERKTKEVEYMKQKYI